ncbi:hypothetical protein LPW26_05935 [Rhodopseudomonas sp. HC1]|uniref:MT-A70 family methyltransferase n=1 Tax=Rhodopseudomonas infernalis TaxID=2897386 RepID=UPI001EE7D5E9|nr:MT-A70 family methyltransferase [Rhodopseudomonas infernalis]MCG6204166.1 hypothetical protein [Rhodopseudomonas infernalis]
MTFLPPGHPPLKFHPLANLFPMLADAEIDDLGADIAEHGQVETVKLHRGMILDGRNRYTACTRKGIGVRTEVFTGTDREALAWVISKNLKRRHLNESQRAMVAARLATLKLGDNQSTRAAAPIGAGVADLLNGVAPAPAGAEPEPLVSQTEAASTLNVGRRSVQRAAVVQEKGAAELQQAVETGQIAVSAAADIAALPIEEQRAIVAAVDPRVVKEIAKKNRSEKQAAGRERRLAKMATPEAAPLLTGKKYGVIYVDLPRKFNVFSDETGLEKSPENHYRTEPFDYLASLREQILALANDNCAMLMWGWACSLFDQMDLLAEFGFASRRPWGADGRLLRGPDGQLLPPSGEGTYRSHQIWAKRASTGNYNRGTGFWWIDCHELLMLGVRGDVPAPLQGTQAMSILDAELGDHSAKPDAFRDQIDRYFPGVPKIELFGRVDDPAAWRARWPDWDVWGNEAAPIAEVAE